MATVTLTERDAKLVADLLELASDRFSNHGCNDFELKWPPGGVRELHRRMSVWNKDDAEDAQAAQDDGAMFYDWYLMTFFAAVLRGEAE